MPNLILLRHGQSMWNANPSDPGKDWKYAGSVDIPLSDVGITQAMDAGKELRDIPLDVVYCSMMIRAQTTALIALATHNSQQAPLVVRDTDSSQPHRRGIRAHLRNMHSGSHSDIIPMYCSYMLNERDFGDVQGMYSSEQRRQNAKEQLDSWRCDWDSPFPNGESSKQVYERTVQFYEKHILPQLASGKNILIVCHGFVVRALIAYLHDLDEKTWTIEMRKDLNKEKSILHVANAEPKIYKFEKDESISKKGRYIQVERKPKQSKL